MSGKYPLLKLIIITAVLLVAGLFLWIDPPVFDYFYPNKKFVKQKRKLDQIFDFIEKSYIDTVSTDSIIESSINDLMGKLDPHSVYIPKDQNVNEKRSIDGQYVGIGVEYISVDDSLLVTRVLPHSPAQKNAIKVGWKLFGINDKIIGNGYVNSDTITSVLNNEENTHFTLYFKNKHKTIIKKLQREEIFLPSISYTLLQDSVAWIKINHFGYYSAQEFRKAITSLKKKSNFSKIILDLRDNQGGLLSAASEILNEFFEDKTLLFYTKDKNQQEIKYHSSAAGSLLDKEVFVLQNEFSASASEIISGAIQEHERGVIIGRRSFGKGLVQEEMQLEDGSVVRLTIAKYYTPLGRSIQKDYKNISQQEYYNDTYQRYYTGEYRNEDSIKVDSSKMVQTRKGRKLYGGGGIIPDIFVGKKKNDFDWWSKYYGFYPLAAQNRINYLKKNGADFIQKYPSFVDFDSIFKSDSITQVILKKLKQTNIPSKSPSLYRSMNDYIKKNIGASYFDPNSILQIGWENDEMIQEVFNLQKTNK